MRSIGTATTATTSPISARTSARRSPVPTWYVVKVEPCLARSHALTTLTEATMRNRSTGQHHSPRKVRGRGQGHLRLLGGGACCGLRENDDYDDDDRSDALKVQLVT